MRQRTALIALCLALVPLLAPRASIVRTEKGGSAAITGGIAVVPAPPPCWLAGQPVLEGTEPWVLGYAWPGSNQVVIMRDALGHRLAPQFCDWHPRRRSHLRVE